MAIRDYPKYVSNKQNYRYVKDARIAIEEIRANQQITEHQGVIGIDTETEYVINNKGVVRFIQGNPNNVPFCVTLYDGVNGYYITENLEALQELIDDTHFRFVFHNHKYDRHMLANIGINLDMDRVDDTMVMIHLIDEEFECKTPNGTKVKSKRLKDLAYHFLGKDAHELEDLVSEYRAIKGLHNKQENIEGGKNAVSYKDVEILNPDLMKDYACADVDFTWHLYFIFKDMMEKQINSDGTTLYAPYKLDMEASDAVFNMERVGFAIDKKYYKGLDMDYEIEIAKLLKELPMEYNVNSSADIKAMFEAEGVIWRWFTEKGEPCTDSKILEELCKYESNLKIATYAKTILEYREYVKLKDTFVKAMLDFCQIDGRVHPDFNICPNDYSTGGTRTGRLSSSNPNGQNMPKDDKRIRKGIIPAPGYMLVEIDAAQQEYRMLAHYSNDEKLINLIKDGVDVHVGTAMLMLGLDHDTAAQRQHRQMGKKLNFAIVYGLGLASLANQLGYKIDEPLYKRASFQFMKDHLTWAEQQDIAGLRARYPDVPAVQYYCSDEAQGSIKKAMELRNKYFAQFPGIKDFIASVKKACGEYGYVKTWGKRRRHFKYASKESYKAPNALIQGSCGDILKVLLHRLDLFLADKKTRMVNTVHDSILFEIDIEEYKAGILDEILDLMRDLPFRVPMDWDAEGSLTSWADIKSLSELDIPE